MFFIKLKEQDTKLEIDYYRTEQFSKHICVSTENMFLRINTKDLPETKSIWTF